MKAKNFLKKAIEAIECCLVRDNLSDYYVIYGKVNKKDEPVVKIKFPDGDTRKFNLESYRLEHKESGISFKEISASFTVPIMEKIATYERNIDRTSGIPEPETEPLVEAIINPQHLSKEYLIQKVKEYLISNTDYDDFMEKILKVNGVETMVLYPAGSGNMVDILFGCPALPLYDIVKNYELDFSLNRMLDSYLEIFENEPINNLNKLFQPYDEIKGDIIIRFLSMNEKKEAGLPTAISMEIAPACFIDVPDEVKREWNIPDEALKAQALSNIRINTIPLSDDLLNVSTNKALFGASAVLAPGIKAIIKNTFGEDGVFIIPSSVNEVIIARDTEETRDIFRNLPSEVNNTISDKITLADSIIEIDTETMELLLTDSGENALETRSSIHVRTVHIPTLSLGETHDDYDNYDDEYLEY